MFHSKHRSMLTTALGAAIVALGLTGCSADSRHVSWQSNGVPRYDNPDQEWWHYKVVYHPDAQAYSDPYAGRVYWFRDGHWYSSDSLPAGMYVDPRLAKVVKVKTEVPVFHHDGVAALHPDTREMPARFNPSTFRWDILEDAMVDSTAHETAETTADATADAPANATATVTDLGWE